MRITLTLLALLPIAASAADESDDAVVETMEESGPQDIVVTATRDRRSAFSTPASITRIDDETIADVGSKHQADVLNRIAGVYVQRGSGAESLTAIRSPVLAGAGACGSFLVAEDSLPIRPVGFCNLNEMFELNYEQARQIEVLRGPGSAMFGASAVHGVVNLLTPERALLTRLFRGTRRRFGLLRAREIHRVAHVFRPGSRRGDWRLRNRDARSGLARRFGSRRSKAQSAERSSGRSRAAPTACRGHGAQSGNRGLHPGLQQLPGRDPSAGPIRIRKAFATHRARACRHNIRRATSLARTRR